MSHDNRQFEKEALDELSEIKRELVLLRIGHAEDRVRAESDRLRLSVLEPKVEMLLSDRTKNRAYVVAISAVVGFLTSLVGLVFKLVR